MSDSILQWMQNYEARFTKYKPTSDKKFNSEKTEIKNFEPQSEKFEESPDSQQNLDNFINKSLDSALFDDNFDQTDFQLFTKQWKEENLSGLVAN